MSIFQLDDWKPCPLCHSQNLHVGVIDAVSYGIICLDCGLRLKREIPFEAPVWAIEYHLMFGGKENIYELHALKRVQLIWNQRKTTNALKNLAKGVLRFLDLGWFIAEDECINNVVNDALWEKVIPLVEEATGEKVKSIWEV